MPRVIASRQPLPVRNGVGASVIVVPDTAPAQYGSLLDFLEARFPNVTRDVIAARMACGEVCDADGVPVAAAHQPVAGTHLYYYRDIPDEPVRFGEVPILFEDELIVVADKPHFMPVTPGGRYLRETLLVRLRQQTGCDDLAPMHRIDRETAGLTLFTKQPETRGRYQWLFESRAVEKTYEAIAPTAAPTTTAATSALAFPYRACHHIEPAAHFMCMQIGAGEPNAVCEVDVVARGAEWSRYRLRPETGKKHQLRVQMAALGLPIRHDQIYPVLVDEPHEDPARALQLLACEIAFADPVTGALRQFRSALSLGPLE